MSILVSKNNIKLVEEGIDLIKKINLISKDHDDLDEFSKEKKFKVITNIEEAYFYAYDFEGDLEDSGYTWTDLRENLSSDILGMLYELKNSEFTEWNKIIEDISSKVSQAVSTLDLNKIAMAVYDDIEADLTLCMQSRAMMGKENSFFEDMFNAYLLGGWPCGWKGNYPEGKMIVYFDLDN